MGISLVSLLFELGSGGGALGSGGGRRLRGGAPFCGSRRHPFTPTPVTPTPLSGSLHSLRDPSPCPTSGTPFMGSQVQWRVGRAWRESESRAVLPDSHTAGLREGWGCWTPEPWSLPRPLQRHWTDGDTERGGESRPEAWEEVRAAAPHWAARSTTAPSQGADGRTWVAEQQPLKAEQALLRGTSVRLADTRVPEI